MIGIFKKFPRSLSLALIIIASVIGYANSVNAPFVFDDYHNISRKRRLKSRQGTAGFPNSPWR
jgi:hypothetical protein